MDCKKLLMTLAPGIEVVQSGLYNAFHPDITCLLSKILGKDVEDVNFECKSFKSFACTQVGLAYDTFKRTISIADKYKDLSPAVQIVNKVSAMQDKVDAIMNKFPIGHVKLDGLSSKEIIKCIQALYANERNKGFCIEDEHGNLMLFPIYSLPNYVIASARLRWHRQGSDASFAGTPYADDAFDKIFQDQNKVYTTSHIKVNKNNPSKSCKKYYNYVKTDANLANNFKHTIADGRTYEFKRVGTTDEWQVRLLRPADATTLCIEFIIKVVSKQRQRDLDDVKYLLKTGKLPNRKYIAIKSHQKHTCRLKQ
jgi:hypothetical protein